MSDVFVIDEVLHVGAVHSLYRATDARDGGRVVLKCLDADHRSEGEAARLRREYALLRGLDVDGVVRALELREDGGELRLVLSDFGGETLAARIERQGGLPLGEGLEIAARLAEILGQVHARGVIHKDIKPRNILVDGSGKVQLIDFGIAAKVSREAPSIDALGAVQGTLAYISPEQTGRVSRGVDHRSDLYSLGVTLFELFVGHAPFTATDPAALIHAHIARLPPEPRALVPSIPRALSALILRLLAKAPEERYRGAFGVAHDLRRLAAALARGESPELTLGERDPPLLLQISEKKRYGREAEVAAVEAAITRVREGGAELVLIRGPAGAGKATLVSDLRRSASESRLLLAAGKCDPLGRDAPYASICAAFSGLLRGLIAEGPEAAARWGWAIERSLGATAGALLPLLPELGELLRAPPANTPSLTPEAARNRLHRAMFCLVRALARPGAPLVLFLEGIHEADPATIELIIAMLGELGSEGFCCVGSCREQVPEGSALTEGLRALPGWCRVTTITLGPLPAAAIAEMIADSLAITREEALPLAEVVAEKTHGSAFFAAEVLRAFDRAMVIRFDGARGAWVIDLAAAIAHPVTSNVVDLLLERLRTLPAAARAALELASCVGDSFTAASIGEAEDEALTAGLAVAAQAGLIEGGEVMRFAHDRVREAIYAAIDAPSRTRHHLALGRRWRARGGLEDERRLFAAVEQYNLGRAAIDDAEERRALALLNEAAAQRARASAAFAAAKRLGSVCLELLGPSAWTSDYELALRASKLVAECEIVDGDLAAGEAMIEALLGRVRSAEDKVEVILAGQAIRTARHQRALVLAGAAEASALLGEQMPTRASTASMIFAVIKAQRAMGRRTPADLAALPAIASRREQLLLDTFGSAASACFEGDTKLLTVIAARMISLTLKYGSSASAAMSLVIYGIAAGAPRRDYALMGAYGRAALAMLDRLAEPVAKVLVCFLYSGMVQPMVQPFRECVADLREGLRRGLELGSNVAAAYCWMALTGHAVASGVNLEEIRSDSAGALALLEKAKVGSVIYNSRIDRGFALALLGESRGPGELSYEGFDEAEIAAKLGGEVAVMSRYVWLSHSMIVNLVLGRLEVARARIREADPGVKEVFRLFHSLSYYLAYRGITLAASAEALRWDQRLRLASELRAAIRELERPRQSCPANFAALQALVAAELARISGEAATAEAYERAIAAAREHGNVHVEAIACERAGRYYLARGLTEAAHAYLLRARRAYLRWGAKAKVALLDEEFRELGVRRERMTLGGPATIAAVSTTLTGESSSSGASSGSSRADHLVDIASVVKAAQAFAAEIDLGELAGKMLKIVVENAGAERGALLLSEGAGLAGFAEYSTRTDALRDLKQAPLEELSELPGAVIRQALRTGQALAIEDAAVDPVSSEDSYVRRRRLRSLLVAPLMVQGRRVGVIYLENNLAAGVFTAERLEVLQILAVQAAIAVEHAGFFRRLDAARAAAEAANVAKSRFLANMSHELRTPLNAILGYTELVREDAEAAGLESVVEDLRRVSEAGDHLLGLIGEILDLTKVESGTSELSREVIVVDALLDEIEALAAAEISRGGNRLVRDRSGELGTMLGDPVRIRQILLNLLGNAAKFTEDGAITLRAAREATRLRFEVEDTGIGISEAQIATIFEPFTQADPSSTRRYGGVGLGLTICQRLCEQMGGSLEARSTLGRGSIFVATLPVNPGASG